MSKHETSWLIFCLAMTLWICRAVLIWPFISDIGTYVWRNRSPGRDKLHLVRHYVLQLRIRQSQCWEWFFSVIYNKKFMVCYCFVLIDMPASEAIARYRKKMNFEEGYPFWNNAIGSRLMFCDSLFLVESQYHFVVWRSWCFTFTLKSDRYYKSPIVLWWKIYDMAK